MLVKSMVCVVWCVVCDVRCVVCSVWLAWCADDKGFRGDTSDQMHMMVFSKPPASGLYQRADVRDEGSLPRIVSSFK